MNEVTELDRIYAEEAAKIEPLDQVILEMYDDFNRQHIATNPAWKNKVDPQTGLVPWEELRRGRFDMPETGLVEGPQRRILSEE